MLSTIDAPLYTTQYTDLKIYAGEEAREFDVHRHILAVHSEFFKVACQNPHFKEGAEQVIRLPTVDAGTMTRLLRWFYQGPLELPSDWTSDDSYDRIMDMLNSADYLGIPTLVKAISEATPSYLRANSQWHADRGIAIAEEQKKVDFLSRLYECGGNIEIKFLKEHLNALKKSRNLGLFMGVVKDLEGCHEALFGDIMVALYATVD
ncbi:hypothetical protein DRE_04145 [Drechslerella stenobrocha 248]|uniref:BTB domain-containing protein n=1 Tax=Drechslerella stenobrocha 248 TaxID=1043628 RepID=W7I3A0_9PEZI|nr:hypothetical protein DRE_04145 [Drechslerella stenobrocha 248]